MMRGHVVTEREPGEQQQNSQAGGGLGSDHLLPRLLTVFTLHRAAGRSKTVGIPRA
jgi:hypothetical protein